MEISLAMKGTTPYCFLRKCEILIMLVVTQLRISSFPFFIKINKGERIKLISPAVLFRYEMWSFRLKE
jgi:hypothetical protein